MEMPYIVGLTGGIGSGKTVVSNRFAELGVPVIDTDVIARQIVEPDSKTLLALAESFGTRILQNDGSLNRDELRKIAFADAENKDILDSITHPAIRDETIKQIAQADYQYCIVVVPLLTKESAFQQLMQRVLLVTADHQTKLARVQKRSGLSFSETEAIMQTQLSDGLRLEFADDVICNDGIIAEAQTHTDKLHQSYLALSQAAN
jgi:dephospho-CoA kinase